MPVFAIKIAALVDIQPIPKGYFLPLPPLSPTKPLFLYLSSFLLLLLFLHAGHCISSSTVPFAGKRGGHPSDFNAHIKHPGRAFSSVDLFPPSSIVNFSHPPGEASCTNIRYTFQISYFISRRCPRRPNQQTPTTPHVHCPTPTSPHPSARHPIPQHQ